MTERFIFSQLNYNGDENAPRRKKRSQVKRIPALIELNPHDTPIVGRPVTMTLIVPPETVAKPWFNPTKYVFTPRGYINKSIFSAKVPNIVESAHYLDSFSAAFKRDARLIIPENENVLEFVLNCLTQIPCNVPLRWGVLFNFKFRRVFQCLTLENWSALLDCLKKHAYVVGLKGTVHFVDPMLNSPEQIIFPESQVSQASSSASESSNSDTERLDEQVSRPSRIDPFRTPERANNSNIHSFLFASPPSSAALNQDNSIKITSVTSTPVARAKNGSIYSMNMSNSISPALADRFDPSTFNSALILAIRGLYNSSETVLEHIYRTLRMLPVSIPLRWGCIYNKHVRVRSKAAAARETGSTLLQWKELRNLLILHNYLDNKLVANCSILKNK